MFDVVMTELRRMQRVGHEAVLAVDRLLFGVAR
jgi:hypothetical protein